MVDVITPTATIYANGEKKWIYVSFAGFNAATEYGVFDALGEDMGFMPKHGTCIVAKTSGATTTIDVDVDISWDGTNYIATDINNIVAYDTYKHHPADGAATDFNLLQPRYWKVYVVDEGTNNVSEVKLWLYGD